MLAFDTTILIDLEKRNRTTIEAVKKLYASNPAEPAIPFLARAEFIAGIMQRAPHNQAKAIAFLNKFVTLQSTDDTADILARLYNRYRNRGLCMSAADYMIAAQAIEHNLVLVTRDTDFSDISELKKVIL